MPTSVEDQLRRLGDAYDELVAEITPDAVIVRSVTPARSRRAEWPVSRLGLAAAVFALVLGSVVAVWAVRRSTEGSVADGPSLTLAPIPPELLPAGAEFVAARETEVGRFELYEVPSRRPDRLEQTDRCLYLRTPEVSFGDCYVPTDTALGQVVEILVVDGERIVWGIVPPSDDSMARLQIGTAPIEREAELSPGAPGIIEPDENGIWYALVDDHATHVARATPGGQTVGPIPSPRVVDPAPVSPISDRAWREPAMPLAIGDVRVVDDGLAIDVDFTGEPEYDSNDPCTARYLPEVRELADGIHLVIVVERPERSSGAENECGGATTSRSLRFDLSAPHVGRRVFVQGRLFDVEAPADTSASDVDIMFETLPPNATLRGSTDTAVGRYRIYDVADSGRVCITHTTDRAGSSGCHDADTIDEGLAWGATSEATGAALWGLAPAGAEIEVTVAGSTVVPNELGFWFIQIDDNVLDFTVETPCCRNVIPVGAPLITIPGSTTSLER